MVYRKRSVANVEMHLQQTSFVAYPVSARGLIIERMRRCLCLFGRVYAAFLDPHLLDRVYAEFRFLHLLDRAREVL